MQTDEPSGDKGRGALLDVETDEQSQDVKVEGNDVSFKHMACKPKGAEDGCTQTEGGDRFFLDDLELVKAYESLKRDVSSLSPSACCSFQAKPLGH